MANSLDKKDDGKPPGFPKVDAGQNKLPPIDMDGDAPKKKRSDDQKRKEKILRRLVKRFERCVKGEKDYRAAALEDRKFVAGDQWKAEDMARRKDDKRPCLTVNKLPTFIHQITNDQRQNRPSINVSPVGDQGDVDSAKMYRGVIRYLERASSADIAYDTAFECAVTSGKGYFRILTERESPKTFDQTIVWRRIRNPFTVYLDPDSQEPDGSDCKFGFVTELIPKDEFKDQWPDASDIPFVMSGAGENKLWVDSDNIRIVEYYEITNERKNLVALSNGVILFDDEIEDTTRDLIAAGGLAIEKEEMVDVTAVTWYKATQVDILEETPWLGSSVPIIPVIGDEIDIEGSVKYSGVVRYAKDAQRMVNYWCTAEAEQLALAPKAPFVMEEGQVEGHEAQWKQANTKSYPYLLYKGVNLSGKPAPPPQRQPPIGIPAGVVQAKQGAAQDMMATTGIRFDATLQERTVDESGRALREIRRTGDLGQFHYVDNLSRAIKRAGQIVVELIPKIITGKRIMTILREDDTEEIIEVNPVMSKAVTDRKDPQTNKTRRVFNPTIGKYGVTVTIGPSYATKRIEAAESMMDFARALPETAKLIADLIAKNQDWPGAQEIATRIAKTLPPNLLTPEMKDMTPQIQALLQSMDAQIKQLTQERMQMVKMLTDQQAERAIMQDKINKDFEAKLLAIMQKADATFSKEVGGQIKSIADGVATLMAELEAKQTPAPAGQAVPSG